MRAGLPFAPDESGAGRAGNDKNLKKRANFPLLGEKLCYNKNIGRTRELSRSARTETGDIAQLVERLNGIQEVMGSIPTISTRRSGPDRQKPVFERKQAFCLLS